MPLNDEQYFACPYCGGSNSLIADISGGKRQRLLQDCEVCCQPIIIRLQIDSGEVVDFSAERENT